MDTLSLPVAASALAFDPEALAEAARRTWEEREAIAGQLRARLPALREAALRNVEMAAALLGAGEGPS